MNKDIRVLTKHILTYGIGGLINGFVRLAFIPIISLHLSPDSFGVYSLLLMIISLLYLLFDLGLSYAVMKWYSEYDEVSSQSKIVGTAITSIGVIGGSLCILALMHSSTLSRFLFRTFEYTPLVRMAVLIALCGSFFQLLLSILRASARPRSFVLFTSVRGLSNVILTISFVIFLSKGIEGFLWGTFLSFGLSMAAFFFMFRPRLAISFEFAKSMLRFGFPLMPSNLAVWILTYADLYLLKVLKGLNEVGLYQFAQEMCAVISLLLVSFERAWPQFVFSRYKETDAAELFRHVFSFFFAALAFVGLTLALFRLEFLSLLSAIAYFESARVIPLLICSGILYGTYYIFGTGLLISGKTSLFPLITLNAALMNILLNIALIPAYGIVGAGFATVLTNCVMAIAILLLSNRYYVIPFDLMKILIVGCAGVFVYVIHHLFQDVFPSSFMLTIFLLVGYGIFIYRFIFYHIPKDFTEIKSTPLPFKES